MTHRFVEFMLLVNAAHKSLLKIKNLEVKDLGLKGSHVMCIFFLGQSESGLTAAELCEKCKEDKSAISRNLKALYDGEFVTFPENENNYRLVITLSEKGKKAYSEILEIIEKTVEECGKGLTDEDRKTFYQSFSLINENLTNVCDTL